MFGTTERDTAVLVMAYGGPDCLDAVGPFMCSLMKREPSPEMLERVQARYAVIGGKSPLPEIACGMAEAIEEGLSAAGIELPVAVGFKYTAPSIGDTLRALHEVGVRDVVAVSLSPFESRSTSAAYGSAVEQALLELEDMRVSTLPPLWETPAFVEAHAQSLSGALTRTGGPSADTLTVFTAHSLPIADLETPELYVSGLREVASAVGHDLGFSEGADFEESDRLPGISSFGAPDSERPWLLAYQSKGMRGGEWLGPDLSDVMEIAADGGFSAVVVSPIGFATEHMETKYDLDVVESKRAQDLGLRFDRGEAPNDEPALIEAIVQSVMDTIERGV